MRRSQQISLTAAFIAIKFYGLMQDPKYRSFFSNEVITFYDKTVSRLPGPLHHFHHLLKNDIVRKGLIGLEELLLPGDLLHILQRKWMINYLWEKKISDRCEQLLVIGAGFDHFAALASQKGINAMEIDLSATCLVKKRILKDITIYNSNLTVKSSGFRGNRFASHIRELSPRKNTFIITEGFWDYQTLGNNQLLLNRIMAHLRGEITLITTLFDISKLNRFHRSVFVNSIRTTGEQIEFITNVENIKKLFIESNLLMQDYFESNEILELMEMSNGTLSILKGFGAAILKKN